MTDKRDILKDSPFSFRESKEKLFIYYKGKEIMVLKDKRASKFLYRIDGLSEFETQLALAKITGQFH